MENSVAGTCITGAIAGTNDTDSQRERPDNFDEYTFHQHLLNFIVADDQVSYHPISLYLQYSCL
jgi:hypothetical protein